METLWNRELSCCNGLWDQLNHSGLHNIFLLFHVLSYKKQFKIVTIYIHTLIYINICVQKKYKHLFYQELRQKFNMLPKIIPFIFNPHYFLSNIIYNYTDERIIHPMVSPRMKLKFII